MPGNERKVGGGRISIPPALAKDKGIREGDMCEWRSFPTTEDEWQRIKREYPRTLVLIPPTPEKERM